MAVEIKKHIVEVLGRLSPEHPDGPVLEEALKSLRGHLSESKIEEIRKEFEIKLHTPESITTVWQMYWNQRLGKEPGEEIIVPPCDRTVREIRRLEEKRRMLVYIPQSLSSSEGLARLNVSFLSLEGLGKPRPADIENDYEQYGWLDVEKSPKSPNQGTGDATVDLLEKEGLKLQTINTYIIGSEFCQITTGNYFDPADYSYSRVASKSKGRRLFVRRVSLETMGGQFLIVSENEPGFQQNKPFMGLRTAKR